MVGWLSQYDFLKGEKSEFNGAQNKERLTSAKVDRKLAIQHDGIQQPMDLIEAWR